MKKSDVLKQQRAALRTEIKPLAEKEELSTEERSTFETKTDEVDQLDKDIAFEEKREATLLSMAGAGGDDLSKQDKKDIRKLSFVRAINQRVSGKALEGIEAEMHQEAGKERAALGLPQANGVAIPTIALRAISGQNVTTAADGGNLVQDDPVMFYEALYANLVLQKLGVKFLSGLKGNLPLVGLGAYSGGWVGEDFTATVQKFSTSKKSLTPKGIVAKTAFTRQLLAQSSPDVESLVRTNLALAMAQTLQSGALAGATNGPTGLLATSGVNSIVMGTNGAIPSFDKLVDMETAIAVDNVAGDLKFLTNPKVRGKMRKILEASAAGSDKLWMKDNTVLGYEALTTTTMPSDLTKGTADGICSAAVLGKWDEMIVGMWGGLDIVVDPYSAKESGEIEVLNYQLADSGVVRPEAFAVCKDILV